MATARNGSKQEKIFSISKGGTTSRPSITINTADEDREHDRILPAGIDFTNYLRAGGPVMYAHDYGELPVGRTTSMGLVPNRGLRADFAWLEGDDRADRVKNAFEQGVLGGASVGIIVKNAAPNDFGGYDITASDLIEWSLTPVPCNPFAVRTLKGLGLWRGDETTVRIADSPLLRRLEAERMRQGQRRALARLEGGDTVRIRIEEPEDPPTVRVDSEQFAKFCGRLAEQVLAGIHESIDATVQTAIRRARGRLD